MREKSIPVPDVEEIVARHTDFNGLCEWCCCEHPCDAVLLAAEVVRLTAHFAEANGRRHACGVADERARIATELKGYPKGLGSRDSAYALGWDDAVLAVLALVKSR